MVEQSLPQLAYCATDVLQNEEKVAKSQNIAMYELMKCAGRAVFDELQLTYPKQKMLVLCGKGNNGGDGFIVAALALKQGIEVEVLLLTELAHLTGEALTASQEYIALGGIIKQLVEPQFHIDCSSYRDCNVIVDAVFGIGFKGALPEFVVELFEQIKLLKKDIVSVDTPSGVNATTGEIAKGAICASKTISFIAQKQGLLTGKAKHYVGEYVFYGLQLAESFCHQVKSECYIQYEHNLPQLTSRNLNQHKGHLGLLLSVGGQEYMPGAIKLSSEAALRCGAPLVSVACHPQNHSVVMANRPELMLAPSEYASLAESRVLNNAKCAVIGPGLGQSNWAKRLFSLIIAQHKNLVIDADALILLAEQSNEVSNNQQRSWVLTPHPKEAALLLGCTVTEIEKDRFCAVKAIARKYQAICVLKGAGTLISDGQSVWVNTTGNHGMATGGMGDVLSGVIGALLLQCDNLLDATRLAVYIHGKAGDNIAQQQGVIGLLASDLLLQFPTLLQKVYDSSSH